MFFRSRQSVSGEAPAGPFDRPRVQLAALPDRLQAFGHQPEGIAGLDLPMYRAPNGQFHALLKLIEAVFAVLEKDPALRELAADFVAKLDYLDLLLNAITRLAHAAEHLPADDPKAYLEGLAALIRDFVAYESCFDQAKSLETWNRLKGAAAAKLDAKQYGWLSAFYARFAVFAAFAGAMTKEAAGLIEAMAKLLARGDKPSLFEAMKHAARAARCIERLVKALGELFEGLSADAAAAKLTR